MTLLPWKALLKGWRKLHMQQENAKLLNKHMGVTLHWGNNMLNLPIPECATAKQDCNACATGLDIITQNEAFFVGTQLAKSQTHPIAMQLTWCQPVTSHQLACLFHGNGTGPWLAYVTMGKSLRARSSFCSKWQFSQCPNPGCSS